jgi:hypothetical protein
MRKRFSFLAVALCGLLLAVAPAAADTVTFSTSFEFTSTGTDTVNLGAATFQLLGVTNSTVNIPTSPTQFGTIVYNRNGEPNLSSQLFDFKLTVTQSSPIGSASSLSNQFVGAILISGGLAAVDFVANPIAIGSIAYTPTATSMFFLGSSGSTPIAGSVGLVNGAVQALPLPAAVWGGMALCAMVGVSKFRRKNEAEL